MTEITSLTNERRALVNRLSTNLSKQDKLRNEADFLKLKLVEVQNSIIKFNSKK